MKTISILFIILCLVVTVTVHALTTGMYYAHQEQTVAAEPAVQSYLLTGMIDSVAVKTVADPENPCLVMDVTVITFSSETSASGQKGGDLLETGTGRDLFFVHDPGAASKTYPILSASPARLVVQGILDPMEVDPATCTYANCEAGSTSFGLTSKKITKG